jgi:hypothetical protein
MIVNTFRHSIVTSMDSKRVFNYLYGSFYFSFVVSKVNLIQNNSTEVVLPEMKARISIEGFLVEEIKDSIYFI